MNSESRKRNAEQQPTDRAALRALAEQAREVGWPSLRTPSPDRITALLDDLDAAERERDDLRRWKSEALPVMDGLQELGRALGLPLGEQITGPCAVEAVGVLTARAERAEAQVAAVRALADEWERVADRLSPGSLTAGVRYNCAAALRAALDTPADTPTEPDAGSNPDRGPRCGECRLGLGVHEPRDPQCTQGGGDRG